VLPTAFALVVALAVGSASADTLWVGQPGKTPLKRDRVRVTGIQKNELQWTTSNGDARTTPLEQVAQIGLDNDAAFSAAEAAYAAKNWQEAAAGYQKVVTASKADWVRSRSTMRLIDSAEKSGDFLGAVSGYVQLLQRDPAAAARHKPDVPKDKPDAVRPAIPEVQRAIEGGRLKPEQKKALQAYLMQMQTAVGNEAAASKLAQDITEDPGTAAARPEATDDGDGQPAPEPAVDPSLAGVQAGAHLQKVRDSLAQKKYKEALGIIDANKAVFIDPALQADALFYRAEAMAGLAPDGDQNALKDAALAYMRVVAHFKDDSSAPHVGESLVKTGTILEKLNAFDEALAVYQQTRKEFKDGPTAAAAAKGIERVKAAKAEREG
jgi:tetratricopeptide (TPR) repeat protein